MGRPAGPAPRAWAQPANTKGAVPVIHENKGLDDWVRSVAGRLAGARYAALAIDVLSGERGTGGFADPAQATAALAKLPPERFTHDLKSGVAELKSRAPGQKVGVVGFCFGGGLVWQLLAFGARGCAPRSRSTARCPTAPPSPEPRPPCWRPMRRWTPASRGRSRPAKAALDRAGLTNGIVVEPGADHAFFNDTGARYDAAAAADAWQRLQDRFGRYLA